MWVEHSSEGIATDGRESRHDEWFSRGRFGGRETDYADGLGVSDMLAVLRENAL